VAGRKQLNFMSKRHKNSPTCICKFKKFPGVVPPGPVLKGREGKGKGRVGVEGRMERKGRWRVGRGRKVRREREGSREGD
jgi:hypothetical protein